MANPAPRIARIYDGLKDGKPNFADRERLDDGPEKASFLAYLKAGKMLIRTTARNVDVFDESKGKVVPRSYRTDGQWFWTDSTTYYLEVHGILPERDFSDHIRALNYKFVEPTQERFVYMDGVLDNFMRTGRIEESS